MLHIIRQEQKLVPGISPEVIGGQSLMLKTLPTLWDDCGSPNLLEPYESLQNPVGLA